MSEVKLPEKMLGMKLPGGAKVEAVEVEVPKPGPGQVLLKMKAASLCGSMNIRTKQAAPDMMM